MMMVMMMMKVKMMEKKMAFPNGSLRGLPMRLIIRPFHYSEILQGMTVAFGSGTADGV